MTPEERIDQYLLGQATAEDIAVLNELLEQDEELRRAYRFRVALEGGYRESALREIAEEATPTPIRRFPSPRTFWLGLSTIAAVVILTIAILQQASPNPVATLVSSEDAACGTPVSLIDLYPTLVDLCGLTGDTRKNDKGHALDGHSLKPLLQDPEAGRWSGPDEALTALYKWRMKYDPSHESYSLRSKDWRYIRYENGIEELYDTTSDPLEWHNLADNPAQAERLTMFRKRLLERLPRPGTIPLQPQWRPKGSNNPTTNAEAWKDRYFAKHPAADANKDGKLTWPEYKAYRSKFDPEPPKAKSSEGSK